MKNKTNKIFYISKAFLSEKPHKQGMMAERLCCYGSWFSFGITSAHVHLCDSCLQEFGDSLRNSYVAQQGKVMSQLKARIWHILYSIHWQIQFRKCPPCPLLLPRVIVFKPLVLDIVQIPMLFYGSLWAKSGVLTTDSKNCSQAKSIVYPD